MIPRSKSQYIPRLPPKPLDCVITKKLFKDFRILLNYSSLTAFKYNLIYTLTKAKGKTKCIPKNQGSEEDKLNLESRHPICLWEIHNTY